MENQNKIDVKKIIQEEGHIRKFDGVAPDGFILIHEKTLESLKDFEIWKEWKNNILELDLKNRSEMVECKKS